MFAERVVARHQRCAYCDLNPADTIDHVVARSQGGRLRVLACRSCNSSKGTRSLEQWTVANMARLARGDELRPAIARATWRLSCPGAWMR